jgi:hypothetical protein
MWKSLAGENYQLLVRVASVRELPEEGHSKQQAPCNLHADLNKTIPGSTPG